MKGMSYEERLQKFKLWSLEERRNRQDLTEEFKICEGFGRIRPEELFHFDDRGKGTRGHYLLNYLQLGARGTVKDIFF